MDGIVDVFLAFLDVAFGGRGGKWQTRLAVFFVPLCYLVVLSTFFVLVGGAFAFGPWNNHLNEFGRPVFLASLLLLLVLIVLYACLNIFARIVDRCSRGDPPARNS